MSRLKRIDWVVVVLISATLFVWGRIMLAVWRMPAP